jgi:histidinol-phosphate phosphatase family protein
MAVNPGNRGLFCDLAGTLVKTDGNGQLPRDGRGAVVIEMLPGVAEVLRPMRDHLIMVVTNQAAIARGELTLDAVEAGLAQLDDQLGGILAGWRICPHAETAQCECRKPRPGMVLDLAQFYGIDLPLSTMVGDQALDEQCAHAAGVGRFVLARDFFPR